MRLILALLFTVMGGAALIQDARGQTITQTCSNGTQSYSIGSVQISTPCPAAVTYTGPGDLDASIRWFYSFRALSQAVASGGTTKSAHLIRASDSHACDVLIATTGGLGNTASCGTGGDNGQSASAFCNATSCTFTWYDQTVNGINTTANSAAPSMTFNAINSTLPCGTLNGSTQGLKATDTSAVQPFTMVAVSQRSGAFTTQSRIIDNRGGGTGSFLQYFSTASKTIVFSGSFGSSITASDSAFHAIQYIANSAGGGSFENVDGTSTSSSGGSNGTSGQIGIGDDQAGDAPLTGLICEAWQSTAAYSSGLQSSIHNNISAYYGTP